MVIIDQAWTTDSIGRLHWLVHQVSDWCRGVASPFDRLLCHSSVKDLPGTSCLATIMPSLWDKYILRDEASSLCRPGLPWDEQAGTACLLVSKASRLIRLTVTKCPNCGETAH